MWVAIASVESLAPALVYDLTVPEHQTYFAHGVWHHNSGKTGIAYGAAAHLLSQGKVKRGIISMPKAPRLEQEDYVDPETGEPKRGKKYLWLKPEMADQFTVVKDGDHLKRLLKPGGAVETGKTKFLLMGPDLIRTNSDLLMDGGFGGEDAFYFGDEAHQLSIGAKDATGSGRAKAANRLAQGAGYSALASGTLIENDASELHGLANVLFPGYLGGQKDFSSEWQRLAQGGHDFFSSEAMSQMRDRLSGIMMSYHEPTMKKRVDADGHTVQVQDPTTGKWRDAEDPVKLDVSERRVDLAPEQKAAIRELHQERKRRLQSDDKNVRRSAGLRFHEKALSVLTRGVTREDGTLVNPKLDALAEELDTRRANAQALHASGQRRDPLYRYGIYSFEKAPLRAAQKRLKGERLVSITGDDGDRATRDAIDQVNDRSHDENGRAVNGVDGVLLSSKGATGVNLQGLDNIAVMHAMNTAASRGQLFARHCRSGQERDVEALQLLARHPVEEMLHFRTTQVKGKEAALLTQLASRSDDAGLASSIVGNLDDVLSAAAGGQTLSDQDLLGLMSSTLQRTAEKSARRKREAQEREAKAAASQEGTQKSMPSGQPGAMPGGEEPPDPRQDPAAAHLPKDEEGEPRLSSLRELDDRLGHEQARACDQYDATRKNLAAHHAKMDQAEEAHTPKLRQLEQQLRQWFDDHEKALDPATAKRMLRYLGMLADLTKIRAAKRIAFGATLPPGEQGIGRPIGEPLS